VWQVERGNSAVTDKRRVASVSKAVCATVLAIASEQSQHGRTPRRVRFDDPACKFIPWAEPLSDPRKARITVQQLVNHTSGLTPRCAGKDYQSILWVWSCLAICATECLLAVRSAAKLSMKTIVLHGL
jgi:CubicO group peptidase (beta-lactamase class C family)